MNKSAIALLCLLCITLTLFLTKGKDEKMGIAREMITHHTAEAVGVPFMGDIDRWKNHFCSWHYIMPIEDDFDADKYKAAHREAYIVTYTRSGQRFLEATSMNPPDLKFFPDGYHVKEHE